jgi:hypothetical protein
LEQVGAIRTLFRQFRNGRVPGGQLRRQLGLDDVHLGLVIGDPALAAGDFVTDVLEPGGQDARGRVGNGRERAVGGWQKPAGLDTSEQLPIRLTSDLSRLRVLQ